MARKTRKRSGIARPLDQVTDLLTAAAGKATKSPGRSRPSWPAF
jgi:hypothetical protein